LPVFIFCKQCHTYRICWKSVWSPSSVASPCSGNHETTYLPWSGLGSTGNPIAEGIYAVPNKMCVIKYVKDITICCPNPFATGVPRSRKKMPLSETLDRQIMWMDAFGFLALKKLTSQITRLNTGVWSPEVMNQACIKTPDLDKVKDCT
jgi:hypothetical protein